MAALVALSEELVTEVAVRVIPVALATGGAVQVVSAPLAELVGLKVPQGAGEQDQLTPPFAESLATVALMVAFALFTATVAGTAPIVTEITGGGGGVLLLLLHATSAAIMHRLTRRRIDLRNVIGHLRLVQPWLSLW